MRSHFWFSRLGPLAAEIYHNFMVSQWDVMYVKDSKTTGHRVALVHKLSKLKWLGVDGELNVKEVTARTSSTVSFWPTKGIKYDEYDISSSAFRTNASDVVLCSPLLAKKKVFRKGLMCKKPSAAPGGGGRGGGVGGRVVTKGVGTPSVSPRSPRSPALSFFTPSPFLSRPPVDLSFLSSVRAFARPVRLSVHPPPDPTPTQAQWVVIPSPPSTPLTLSFERFVAPRVVPFTVSTPPSPRPLHPKGWRALRRPSRLWTICRRGRLWTICENSSSQHCAECDFASRGSRGIVGSQPCGRRR